MIAQVERNGEVSVPDEIAAAGDNGAGMRRIREAGSGNGGGRGGVWGRVRRVDEYDVVFDHQVIRNYFPFFANGKGCIPRPEANPPVRRIAGERPAV